MGWIPFKSLPSNAVRASANPKNKAQTAPFLLRERTDAPSLRRDESRLFYGYAPLKCVFHQRHIVPERIRLTDHVG